MVIYIYPGAHKLYSLIITHTFHLLPFPFLILYFLVNKILGRGLGSTQSKGRAPNSWSTGACPCGLWSMTSKPFLSVHTGRLLPASLSYGDASPSAAMETQQSVTPQDRTRDVVVNPKLIVQSFRHWTHRRWVNITGFFLEKKFVIQI